MHVRQLLAGLLLAELICLSAFVLELSRALSGNVLSWAYVVEWPVLGAYAIYMWRKLLREESLLRPEVVVPSSQEDRQLTAYNEYLARIHSRDSYDHGDEEK